MSNQMEVYDKINDVPGILELGRAISGSRMFGCDNEEQGVIFALQCIAERKPPFEMAKNYHVIQGKLSKRADAMLADFRKAGGKFVFADIKNTEEQSAKVEWEGETYNVSFTSEDAKRAGLLPAKPASGWAKYPAAMLRARLVSETLRAIAPEIVQGTYTPEEIGDFDSKRDQAAEILKSAPVVTPAKKPEMKKAEAVAADPVDEEVPMYHLSDLEKALPEGNEDQINAYLVKIKWITEGQTYRNLDNDKIGKIMGKLDSFLRVAGISKEAA